MCTYHTGAGIPPDNVMVTNKSSSTITIEWKPPNTPCRDINGNITSYSIRYRIHPNAIPQNTLQSEGLQITLTGLTPFTKYYIEVAAVNENGDVGVYSVPQVVVTDEARMLCLSFGP